MRKIVEVALGAALAVAAPSAWAGQAPPAYDGPSVFVPFAPAKGGGAYSPSGAASPTMEIAFCGRTQRVVITMDTGSTGLIASPDLFTPCQATQQGTPGQITYSSSGIVENGAWYTSTVQLNDPLSHTPLASATIPVMQVTSITCTANARHCNATNQPQGVAMMGIGFGRWSAQQPQSTADHNAFLNLTQAAAPATGALAPLPANWRNGYVITAAGAWLGLSAANTAGAGWVKLAQASQSPPTTATLPEWSGVPAELVVNGVSAPGSALMDTGVGIGYLSPPPAATVNTTPCQGGNCLADGSAVQLYLPSQAEPQAVFGFTIATPPAAGQPMGGVIKVSDPAPFYNTSRIFYAQFNEAFDAIGGWVGYVPVK